MIAPITYICGIIVLIASINYRKNIMKWIKAWKIRNRKPLSVNYHFTRVCNYNCKFCFHTNKTSNRLERKDVKKGFKMLKEAKMGKINFSGGEPFLYEKGLGWMVEYCKKELGIPNVSIVSNGSKIKESWIKEYGKYVDMLAISCDSFNPRTLHDIGRGINGRTGRQHLEKLKQIKEWCDEYDIKFKINSVICKFNCAEDMVEEINELNPMRWKVFQMLLIDGENASEEDLRQAKPLEITTEQFNQFLARHEDCKMLVPESNQAMRNSYIILDENMCFLDNREGNKRPTASILDVGFEKAFQEAGFDEEQYVTRNGDFWNAVNSMEKKEEMGDIEDLYEE